MKKALLLASVGIVLAGCAKTEVINAPAQGKSGVIGFSVGQTNSTKAKPLSDANHYNFGVFAYKSTDLVNNVMNNYLVGFQNDAVAYTTSGTSTLGDAAGTEDGKSMWMYEGMGYAEYNGTYAGTAVNKDTQFASNNANQYLRYWDKSAANTYFYAYAPYVNNVYAGKEVKYVDGTAVGTSTDTYVMTIPNGTLKAGYDDESKYEFMVASTKVAKANYGHDVALNFSRLNAKVNIKFWEDIKGYDVRIIDVNNTYGISAVPAIKDGASGNYGYKLGKIYTENGAKIQFNDGAKNAMKQYEGTTASAPVKFAVPTVAKIADNRVDATPSATTYYAIPKGSAAGVLANGADKMSDAGTLDTDLALTGLTFHVSYELISDTGEKITVKDATVFVPTAYTNWEANTHYTYIFKITKNSNGSTDSDVTPNPEDPEVPTELGLYPIVFDNCSVEDWNTQETEHNFSDGTSLAYHDVQLSAYSIVSGDITVTVTDNDSFLNHAIDYTKIAVTGPAGADMTKVTYASATKTITVAAGATPGIYTVTYTCAPGSLQYNNHPATWSETFVVGNAYTVSTNLDEAGTYGLAASQLTISATMNGSAAAPALSQLSIEYPVNLTAAEKALVAVKYDTTNGLVVEVAPTAAPGKYKLVYKVDEGVEVKVAEKVFEVKDYSFTLDHSVVYLGASPVAVKATVPVAAGVISMASSPTGITVDDATKTVTVANTADEGTYTVTYTLNGSTASEVQYRRTFKVENTYAVALNKTTISRDLGRANDAAQGTDSIEITTLKNGVATGDVASSLKVTLDGTDVTAADFTIANVSANKCALKVNKTAAVGKVYSVEYTGQAGKIVKADFTVQN